jgi:hypothetical protein
MVYKNMRSIYIYFINFIVFQYNYVKICEILLYICISIFHNMFLLLIIKSFFYIKTFVAIEWNILVVKLFHNVPNCDDCI